MAAKRVLQVGMDPSVIDFSDYPGQDADQLRARIDRAAASLADSGLDVTPCLLPADVDAADQLVRSCLAERTFDVIEIGSGLRTSHEYTLIFEKIINTIITVRPGIPLCFNDSPDTTLDAVRRGLTR